MYQPDWSAFRRKLRLSQELFGVRIGVTKDRVSYVERIAKQYRDDELRAIEREFSTEFMLLGVPVKPIWFDDYQQLSDTKKAAVDAAISALIGIAKA